LKLSKEVLDAEFGVSHSGNTVNTT